MDELQGALPLSGWVKIPEHVVTFDEYFMYVAVAISIKSKDPKCAVGAVIASKDHLILSSGFNGLARGVHDDDATLNDAVAKIKVICHAEGNAITNAAKLGGRSLDGATIYVTKFPCLACCNSIIQAGIKRICTHDNWYWNDDPLDGTHILKKRVLHEAGIEVYAPFHPDFRPAEPILVPKKMPGSVTSISSIASTAAKN